MGAFRLVGPLDQALSYNFRWISNPGACVKCRSLHDREYRDQDLFQPVLMDAEFGVIWNLDADHSTAHGRQEHNCRCTLVVKVALDLNEIPDFNELAHFRVKGFR